MGRVSKLAMAENVRVKAEEFRTKIRSRLEEIRGGGSSHSSGGILGGNPEILKGPLVTEIRAKGLVATARSRIEKFRGGGGILGSSGTEKVAVEPERAGPRYTRGRIAIE